MKTYTLPKTILSAVVLFVAKNEVRGYLNGVNVSNDGTKTRITASDGATLVTGAYEVETDTPFNILIDAETVNLALKRQGKVDSVLSVDGDKFTLNGIPFEPVKVAYPEVKRLWDEYSILDGKPCLINPNYWALVGKASKIAYGRSVPEVFYSSRNILFTAGNIRGIVMAMHTPVMDSDAKDAIPSF